MGGNSKPSSYYILTGSGLLLVLSVVGSTLRFMVISATLISWLQTQWSVYVSVLKQRRTARLAAVADKARIRRREQIADIAGSVGENVITLLDKRRERILALTQKAERVRHENEQAIVKRIIYNVAIFQESDNVKDEQLKAREADVSNRERRSKEREEAVQDQRKRLEKREQGLIEREEALRKQQNRLEKREQQMKDAEDSPWKTHPKAEESRMQSHQGFQPLTPFQPVASISFKINLPSDLLEYSKELNSFFTCIGVTQKGARCQQSMISNANKSAAAQRIAKMESSDPGDTLELNALQQLADWMLCPRWHRDKKPQGAQIGSRWYGELSDARARLKMETQTHINPFASVITPLSTITSSSTSPAASIFSSNGSGKASNFSSTQSTPYTGSSFRFMGPQGTMAAVPEQPFKNSAMRDLTPLFKYVNEQSQ